MQPDYTYIIAEASGNHQQDFAKAQELVLAAKLAGADAVKFQLFTPETICADIPLPFGHDPKTDAWFQQLGVTRLRELFSKGGIPRAWCLPLKELAATLEIDWLCTPFSLDEARFLVEEVGVKALKIASGDLTFRPLITYAGTTGLQTFLSTGGATLAEVREAVRWFGEGETGEQIEDDAFGRPNYTPKHLTLLHCVSVYPCKKTLANLRAITLLSADLWLPVGFSDHTLDTTVVPALAVAAGASMYEKHLRLADDHESIDAAHSLDPDQFRTMVEVIRQTPTILGEWKKEPCQEEGHDRLWARRDPSDWLRPTEGARQGKWA